MKTSKVVTAIIATGILGLGTLYAMNQNSNEDSRFQMRKMMMQKAMMHRGDMIRSTGMIKLFKTLNLSDEQTKTLVSLRDEMREKMQNRRDIDKIKNELGEFFTKSGFDKEGFIKQVSEKFDEKIELRADYIEKMYNVLTSEQKTKLIEELTK